MAGKEVAGGGVENSTEPPPQKSLWQKPLVIYPFDPNAVAQQLNEAAEASDEASKSYWNGIGIEAVLRNHRSRQVKYQRRVASHRR